MLEWRPVVGYEETHEVSACGKVRSLPRKVVRSNGVVYPVAGRVLKTGRWKGYEKVGLTTEVGLKTTSVHALVAAAFIGPRPEGMEINHKDGNRGNNHVGNLEYVTPKQNTQDSIRRKTFVFVGGHNKIDLPESVVAKIGTMSDQDLADIAGVSKKRILVERHKRGLPSYAERTGNDGRYRPGNFPDRWRR